MESSAPTLHSVHRKDGMSVEKLKGEIIAAIDAASGDLKKLALDIHDNPELGWHEFKAAEFIRAFLEKRGFAVQSAYKDIPTSFRADCAGRPGGPRVAFLAEYDALNGVGHGCGHNLIAACSVGAFLGLASVIKELQGSVCLIGTPAEEGGSGKVKLLKRGAFDDVDFAMMMHPSSGGKSANIVGRGGRAAVGMSVEFHGKAAHSSVPKNGINALSALISLFNQIDVMRPTFEPQDNVNGIITCGGILGNNIGRRVVLSSRRYHEPSHGADGTGERLRRQLGKAYRRQGRDPQRRDLRRALSQQADE